MYTADVNVDLYSAEHIFISDESRMGHTTVAACGLRVVRIDLLHFLAGCRKKRLDRALSVLSLILGFLRLCVMLLTRDYFLGCYFYVICVFCLLVVLVRLSVPVQVIDWKDSSPK